MEIGESKDREMPHAAAENGIGWHAYIPGSEIGTSRPGFSIIGYSSCDSGVRDASRRGGVCLISPLMTGYLASRVWM